MFLLIIVMAIISIVWGNIALCAYKVHCMNKTCTKVAKGLLKELKCDFVGIHTMPKFTGKLSFKTEKGSNINVNYEKGAFERLPFSYYFNNLFAYALFLAIYTYWGLVAVIIPTTFCSIICCLPIHSNFITICAAPEGSVICQGNY